MAENSNIEWTDHTVNFVIGCVEVSEECANCYARSLDRRYKWGDGKEHWGKDAPRYVRAAKALAECRKLDAKARKAGRVDKVFINSLSDTFEERGDLETARTFLFKAIVECPNLIFQLLTKRPENVLRSVPTLWRERWPSNAWIGTTTGLQKTADKRIPELLKIPAKVRFLSCEPLLGPLDLRPVLKLSRFKEGYDAIVKQCGGEDKLPTHLRWSGVLPPCIHWVICGGESGHKKRPMDLAWARSLRDQCAVASVPFFMKQIDKVQPIPADLMIREFPQTKHGENLI
jgi:protein gp37